MHVSLPATFFFIPPPDFEPVSQCIMQHVFVVQVNMVKAEVKTPNKRKSIANNTPKIKVEKDSPVKKIKIENDTPAKKIKPENGQTPILKKEIVPSPKNNKKNQQGKPTNGAGPKPFKGTQQLNTNQKTNKGKPGQGDGVEKKKRRKSQFGTLMAEVKAKSGTKDAEVLTKLNQRIKDIKARGELTKTAKKKLSILNKMKLILEEGGDVAAAKSKIQRQKDIEEARKAREAKKALKKTDGTQVRVFEVKFWSKCKFFFYPGG